VRTSRIFLSMMSHRTPTVQWNIVDAVSRSPSQGQNVKIEIKREGSRLRTVQRCKIIRVFCFRKTNRLLEESMG
jgi:hypothetical protein